MGTLLSVILRPHIAVTLVGYFHYVKLGFELPHPSPQAMLPAGFVPGKPPFLCGAAAERVVTSACKFLVKTGWNTVKNNVLPIKDPIML